MTDDKIKIIKNIIDDLLNLELKILNKINPKMHVKYKISAKNYANNEKKQYNKVNKQKKNKLLKHSIWRTW